MVGKKLITADQLKKMNSLEFTKATEKLSVHVRLNLAILAGAGDKGIETYRGKDMSNGRFYHETLDYEALAEVLNQEEK